LNSYIYFLDIFEFVLSYFKIKGTT